MALNAEIETLSEDVKNSVREVATAFLENYRPGVCDCDPSVGINGCVACAARFLLNVDKYGNEIKPMPYFVLIVYRNGTHVVTVRQYVANADINVAYRMAREATAAVAMEPGAVVYMTDAESWEDATQQAVTMFER